MQIEVCFLMGSEAIEDNTWDTPIALPRINESILLGSEGKYYWYTIKAINWATAGTVIFILTDKREMVDA